MTTSHILQGEGDAVFECFFRVTKHGHPRSLCGKFKATTARQAFQWAKKHYQQSKTKKIGYVDVGDLDTFYVTEPKVNPNTLGWDHQHNISRTATPYYR
jgi:hypothetical protein